MLNCISINDILSIPSILSIKKNKLNAIDKNQLNENSLSFCFSNDYNYTINCNYIYWDDYFWRYYKDSRLQNITFSCVIAYQTTVLCALLCALNIKINKKT
jgi:hypothetical protein